VPKKSSRRKGGSRKSPKKLILELVLEHEKLPRKPPFFRASWTVKEKTPKRRK
jgi:hypothetical protein